MNARQIVTFAALCVFFAAASGARAAAVAKDAPCSAAQLATINKSQEAAKSRVLSAKLSVTQSPQRTQDRSQGGARGGNAARGASARDLAVKLLDADPRKMTVEAVLANMFTVLTNKNMPVRCAKANESLCKESTARGKPSGWGAAAFVMRYPRAMSFCPKFFTKSSVLGVSLAESQIQTVVHETAHMAGVGFTSSDEEYCWDGLTCLQACGSGNPSASADNWGQFVHCASGQKPATPATIKRKH